VDVYVFSAVEGDLIFIGLDGDPHRTNAPINARLELLDVSGTTLVAVNDSAFTSQGGTNVTMDTLLGIAPSSPGESLVYRAPVEGTFFARVSISPTATGASGAGDYLLSISKNCVTGNDGVNHAPTFSNLALTSPIFAGVPMTLTGTLWEVDSGDVATLFIDWGDGTTNVVAYNTPGQLNISVSHTFTTGNANYTISLLARDSSGATATATVPASVRPPPQPARFEAITRLPGGSILLQLRGTPMARYRVESNDGLTKWNALGSRVADLTGLFSIEDAAPTASSRFYRAVFE
jgi:hypothetical protein